MPLRVQRRTGRRRHAPGVKSAGTQQIVGKILGPADRRRARLRHRRHAATGGTFGRRAAHARHFRLRGHYLDDRSGGICRELDHADGLDRLFCSVRARSGASGTAAGHGAALSAALDGFTNPAVALIAASLVIAAAMAITGLDQSRRFQGDFAARHEPQPPAHRHHRRHGGARLFHSDRLRPCRLSDADHSRPDLGLRHRQEKPRRRHADDGDLLSVADLGDGDRDRRGAERLCQCADGANDPHADFVDRLADRRRAVLAGAQRRAVFRADENDGAQGRRGFGRRSFVERGRDGQRQYSIRSGKARADDGGRDQASDLFRRACSDFGRRKRNCTLSIRRRSRSRRWR